jgi:hypothetical protein
VEEQATAQAKEEATHSWSARVVGAPVTLGNFACLTPIVGLKMSSLPNLALKSPDKMLGSSSGCGWRRWPPDMEGSCEYTEKAFRGSQQGVELHMGLTTPHHKNKHVTRDHLDGFFG